MNGHSVALDPMRLALVGVPNCGKTALFNRLTGSRQNVANYAGVTVERKEGSFVGPVQQRLYKVLDLPGAYSLTPTTLDEAITRDFLLGRLADEPPPEFVVCVVDATNLRLNLRLVLELRDLGVPMVVALNMSDLAAARGYRPGSASDSSRNSACRSSRPSRSTTTACGCWSTSSRALPHPGRARRARLARADASTRSRATQREVRRILRAIGYTEPVRKQALARFDALVMHPVAGPADPRRRPVLRVPGGVQLGRSPDGADRRRRRRARRVAAAGAARRRAAQPAGRRHHRRRRQRAGVPAADPDPVPVHPRARGQRLPAARRVPARPPDGHGRPVGPRLHPAAVELRLRHSRHHGDAHDSQPRATAWRRS